MIFFLGGLRKKVPGTLTDFALKILSLYSLIKSVFNIMKDLFKSFEVLRRGGKIQKGFPEEGFFVVGGLK